MGWSWIVTQQLESRSTMKTKLVSFSNFNPIALFSLILFLVSLLLGSVGTGLDEWSTFETERTLDDGDLSTLKSQGLFQRCIDYDLSRNLNLGIPKDNLPQDDCIDNTDVNCSRASSRLLSALDIPTHEELHNSDEKEECEDMKAALETTAAFMVVGILLTFAAMVLYFPLLHWMFYVIGACVAVISVIMFVVGLSAYVSIPQDFAGYFSVEGVPEDGCLSFSFGLNLAAFLVNIIATVVGVIAIFYRKMKVSRNTKQE